MSAATAFAALAVRIADADAATVGRMLGPDLNAPNNAARRTVRRSRRAR